MCSTGLGVIAEPALAHLIEAPLEALGVSASLKHPIAFVLALAIVVYLHVVLGEMVPKNLSVSGPDKAVMWFGPPLVYVGRILKPIIYALNWIANHAVRFTGVEPKDEVASAFTAEEVQSILEHSRAQGSLADEQGLLAGAIEFSERDAVDVMVPVEDLVLLHEGCTADDVERLVARTGYSRFPVADAAGDLLGYLHLKDVLFATDDQRHVPLQVWRVRALAEASPGDEIEVVLRAMQRSGAHLARIWDGTSVLGVVFLEDILEELVGEVRDAMQRDVR